MAALRGGGISDKTRFILTHAFDNIHNYDIKLTAEEDKKLYNEPVYHKMINDTMKEKMEELNYKIGTVKQWDEEYDKFMTDLKKFPCLNVSKEAFERSIEKAKASINELKDSSVTAMDHSSEGWEDIDSSRTSNKSSFLSCSSEKGTTLSHAKKTLLTRLQESSKKRTVRLSKNSDKSGTTPLKTSTAKTNTTSSGRALKRQASSVLAPEAKKDKKSSGMSELKTEFARSQNSRVRLVKERKELQDKEKQRLLEAKIQLRGMSLKEKKLSCNAVTKASSATKPTEKATEKMAAPPPPPPPELKMKSIPKEMKTLAKNSPLSKGSPLRPNMGSPVLSMQNKAKSGLRHGELAKQAMYHSILASAEEFPANVNSTFLPGINAMPNFDASLAMKGNDGGETFVVDGNFNSKPGLLTSPAHKSNVPSDFVSSFNESFRDYGIDDLCSDSDNTDDENAPSKPVPKWADIKSKRFKDYVKRQTKLGSDIVKYGAKEIFMPTIVDLEEIFEEKNKRFDRLNTSSGIWNETMDFIK